MRDMQTQKIHNDLMKEYDIIVRACENCSNPNCNGVEDKIKSEVKEKLNSDNCELMNFISPGSEGFPQI